MVKGRQSRNVDELHRQLNERHFELRVQFVSYSELGTEGSAII